MNSWGSQSHLVPEGPKASLHIRRQMVHDRGGTLLVILLLGPGASGYDSKLI